MKDNTIISLYVHVAQAMKPHFVAWQAKLNAEIAMHPGFVSLEISSPQSNLDDEWGIIQRFSDSESASLWRYSTQYLECKRVLQGIALDKRIEEKIEAESRFQGAVTEVFITQVSPEKQSAYREWIAKIHQAEASFPGFRGVYVQAPTDGQGSNWITLLQFDTPENLDRWLVSKERKAVLDESAPLITAIENHRMISPYGGWFASLAKSGIVPPVWKQTMLVLLVLYPIVMLELKYLMPRLQGYNNAVATFIGNALSVTLISWPMMPIAIFSLGFWLILPQRHKTQLNILGFVLVVLLYLLEIIIFF